MKRLILFALLGGLSFASQSQSVTDNEVRVRGYTIELPATPYRMFSGDFNEVKGGYDLSNGDVMTLRQVGRRMYAQMGKQERKEVVAASPYIFVALDKQLKITLVPDGHGDFGGHILMVVPSRTAQATDGQEIRMLSLR